MSGALWRSGQWAGVPPLRAYAAVPADALTTSDADDDEKRDYTTMNAQWKAVFTILAVVYTFILAASCVFFYRLLRKEQREYASANVKRSTSWQKTFHAFLILGSFCRMLYFILCDVEAFERKTEEVVPSLLNFALNTLPTFFFFSTYLILLFFWAEIYHSGFHGARGHPSISRFRNLFIGLNLFMYVFVAVFFILNVTIGDDRPARPDEESLDHYQKAILIFGAVIYVGCALGFFAYGTMLFVRLRQFRRNVPSLMVRVGAITLIVVDFFLVRAVIVVLGMYSIIKYQWYVVLIYFLGCEALALGLIFYILHSEKGGSAATRGTGGGGSGGGGNGSSESPMPSGSGPQAPLLSNARSPSVSHKSYNIR